MSQIQYLDPRFWSQVLENVLDLGPMSQVYVLGTEKCPGIRFYVLEKILDFGHKFQKMSQIQGLDPRFRSQVLENVLVQVLGTQLDPRCRTYVLKSTRFRSNIIGLGPRFQKMSQLCPRSQIQVLGPRRCPRIRSQGLEVVLELGLNSQKRPQIQFLGPRYRSQVLEFVLDLGSRFEIQDLVP